MAESASETNASTHNRFKFHSAQPLCCEVTARKAAAHAEHVTKTPLSSDQCLRRDSGWARDFTSCRNRPPSSARHAAKRRQRRNRTTEKLSVEVAALEAHPRRIICSGLTLDSLKQTGPPCGCITHSFTPETLAGAIARENDHLWFTEWLGEEFVLRANTRAGGCAAGSRWNAPLDRLCLLNSWECLGSHSHLCPLVRFVLRDRSSSP